MISFDEFCNLPPNEIAKHTPASMIFAAGGTRRAAKLAGIEDSNEYVRWSAEQLLTCFGLFAKYGIEHIITHAIVPSQWMEVTPDYREKLVEWVKGTLTSKATISEYERRGWREAVIGTDPLSELGYLKEKLSDAFPKSNYSLTVYYAATFSYNSPWENLSSVLEQGWKTQDDLILAQYK